MRRLIRALGGAFAAALALSAAPASAAGPFQDWAAVVVAGDFRAHNGGPSEAFDNARRDVSRTLETMGFSRANLRQFSVRPTRYNDPRPLKSESRAIYEALTDLTTRAPGGCLVYFSSHGSPQGVVVGDQLLAPALLGAMLDRTCGARPTIVVVSACYSGVFIPELAQPNRMVLTAARPDRTSFGCGESDRYPYFDDCFLQSARGAHDFPGLAALAQACVAVRERKEGMQPPSEPQVFVGAALRPMLPLYSFADPAALAP